MSRSIKVTEEVYNELQALQLPRETLSHVISRLLWAHRKLLKFNLSLVGGKEAEEADK